MATLQDCIKIEYEENPCYENAVAVPTTGPNRISTVARFFPITAAKLSPKPAMFDRSDELRSIEGALALLADTFAPDGSFAENAYINDLVFLFGLAGFTPTFTAGGAGVADAWSGVSVGSQVLPVATFNMVSTDGLPASGAIVWTNQTITYTGKTATTLTGCTGGTGTVPAAAPINGNVPATATKVVFTKRVGLIPQTARITVCHTDEQVFYRGQGFGISQLDLDASGKVSASLLGLVFARLAADPNLTPTYDSGAIDPARRGNLYLSWLGNTGDTDDFSMSISNPLSPDYSLGLAQPSKFPNKMYNGDERVKVTGKIPKKALAAADLDALIAATTFSAKAQWRADKTIAATTYPYSLWVEMPSCQYSDGSPNDAGNKRRIGGDFDWWAAYDETAGYDVRITCVGTIGAVATYP